MACSIRAFEFAAHLRPRQRPVEVVRDAAVRHVLLHLEHDPEGTVIWGYGGLG